MITVILIDLWSVSASQVIYLNIFFSARIELYLENCLVISDNILDT